MRALVTGAAGFLGSHVVRGLLGRGDEAVVFDHRLRDKCLGDDVLKRVAAVEDDIFNADAVRDAARGCAAIFHCAAMVGIDAYTHHPAKTMETEEVGLRNVCRAALAGNKVRVIYASSSAVYGRAGGDVGLSESHLVGPVSNYGIAKRFNEMYLAAECAERGLQSVALRIFNMYGPGQDNRLVIPRFIESAIEGRDLVIYGDGSQTRDFVFVGDVVDAMLASANRVAGCEIVNVCSGQEVSVRDLAERIIRLAGSRSRIEFRNQPAERVVFEQRRCFGDRTKMQRMTDAAVATTLELGLRRTIESMITSRLEKTDGKAKSQ